MYAVRGRSSYNEAYGHHQVESILRRENTVLVASLTRAVTPLWRALPIPARRFLLWLLQPTYNVGVSAVLLDAGGRVLLVRHRLRESVDWAFPGGLLQRGESPAEALTRELKEETGYEIEVVALLSAEAGTRWHLDLCYAARLRGGQLRLDERELTEARFFAPSELPTLITEEDVRRVELARARVFGA